MSLDTRILPRDDSTRDIDQWRLNQKILNNEAVLGSTFGITAPNGTYEDTGLSITLPMEGEYLIWFDVRGVAEVATNPPGRIIVMLYNADLNEFVANSEREVVYAD